MRLNLTLPPEIDRELDRVARVTGRSKASFIVEAVTALLPRWRRLVRELDGPGSEKRPGITSTSTRPTRRSDEGKAAFRLRLKRWEETHRST